MPHKRNPVASEQISGLARVVRGNLQTALENVPLWNERDISHSSAERMILPSSYILTDHILRRATSVLDNLIVYPEKMRENLDSMKGLVFSGQVLLLIAKKGLRARRRLSPRAEKRDGRLAKQRHIAGASRRGRRHRQVVVREELDQAFDLEKQMEHVDTIYKRVFG